MEGTTKFQLGFSGIHSYGAVNAARFLHERFESVNIIFLLGSTNWVRPGGASSFLISGV